jgi:hypothetical protein
MIKAHGATYKNMAQINARIAELSYLNRAHGDSDGRVTELNCIFEALEMAAAEKLPNSFQSDYKVKGTVARIFSCIRFVTRYDGPDTNDVNEEIKIQVANVQTETGPFFDFPENL